MIDIGGVVFSLSLVFCLLNVSKQIIGKVCERR